MPARHTDPETMSELTRLGHAVPFPPDPASAPLECFPNRTPDRDYWVLLDYPEFSSLCPVTGQPDTARIRIAYVPAEQCLETKALKYYLASWRNQAAFNEEIVNRLLSDLSGACRPKRMIVRGDFSARGGIRLTARAEFPTDAGGNPFGL